MQPQSPNPGAGGPRSVFIVAGGPSAKGLDHSVLDGSYVLAVNDAIFHVPRAEAVVSIDRNWMIDNAQDLIKYEGLWYLLRRVGEVHPIARSFQRCGHFSSEPGLSESWGIAHTMGSSGYAALNIAYLMRPQFIGLIGYDYDASGRHWYDDEKKLRNKKTTWETWAAAYDSTVQQIEAAGIEVINFSEHSRIAAFPRVPLDTIRQYVNQEALA